jgi:hypothetical protein
VLDSLSRRSRTTWILSILLSPRSGRVCGNSFSLVYINRPFETGRTSRRRQNEMERLHPTTRERRSSAAFCIGHRRFPKHTYSFYFAFFLAAQGIRPRIRTTTQSPPRPPDCIFTRRPGLRSSAAFIACLRACTQVLKHLRCTPFTHSLSCTYPVHSFPVNISHSCASVYCVTLKPKKGKRITAAILDDPCSRVRKTKSITLRRWTMPSLEERGKKKNRLCTYLTLAS